MNIKILEWNINQRSHYRGRGIELVSDEIRRVNADLVCLTEYVKGEQHSTFCDEMHELGYSTFLAPTTGDKKELKNEILLAVKTNFLNNSTQKITGTDEAFSFTKKEVLPPNFLHLQIDFNDEPLHIIGCRIQTRKDYNIEDAKERMDQIHLIVEYIKKLYGGIVVTGDFNNFFYSETSTVYSWSHDKTYLQNYYSYPLLIKAMNEVALTAYTPKGYSWKNEKEIQFRLDHLFTNLKVNQKEYSWEFTENPKYRVANSYPDHAMLIVHIEKNDIKAF